MSDPVLPCSAVAAGFEIGMLLRCARTGSGRHERIAIEFSRADAAARLAGLLGSLGLTAGRVDLAAGGRHRYTVHRVVCPSLADWPLDHAWRLGYQRLCGGGEYRSARQRRHRADLAEAAWRAAVLSGGVRGGGRSGPLAVRASDMDVAVILVRAARILDAPARLHSVAGRHLVEVTHGAAELALRRIAAWPSPAGAVPDGARSAHAGPAAG
jgi:hypothetical protein